MSERTMPLLERIARVLAGAELSANAEGTNRHAADAVDDHWRDHLNQAMAILHTMREPDPGVTDPSEAAAWRKLVDSAIANG
ncbi:hypothetical protein [Sphingomonas edaphi]